MIRCTNDLPYLMVFHLNPHSSLLFYASRSNFLAQSIAINPYQLHVKVLSENGLVMRTGTCTC